MDDEQFRAYSQKIWRQIIDLPREDMKDWQKIDAAFEDLNAGFQAYLHKLSQPTEWIEMVVQLAGQAFSMEHDS